MGKQGIYHYKESGLDNVFLVGGYEYINAPGGKTAVIRDVDALHRLIGHVLVQQRRGLTGKEFRFLRSEMLLSQANLAKVLGVKELTVGRWERGETEIPLSADATVRMMFMESMGKNARKRSTMRELLERIADLEDDIDRKLEFSEYQGTWKVLEKEPALRAL